MSDDKIEQLAGQVRALEALIREMGLTTDHVRAAKKRVRKEGKRKSKAPDLVEQVGLPFDKYAEETLDHLEISLEREKRDI